MLIIVSSVIGQKWEIKIEKDTVFVNGKSSFIIERVGGSASADSRVKTMDGKEIAFFKFQDFYDSKEISSGNTKGRVTYYEITFLNSGQQCEANLSAIKKQMAKFILDFGLIKDGQPDETAIDNFVKIHGTKFSERRKNSTTIIINN